MSEKTGLAEAIEALRRELTVASDAALGKELKFRTERVEVELAVVSERTDQGSAGIKFWVVGADGKYEEALSRTHRVTITLIPVLPSGPVYTGDDQIPG